MLRRAAPLVRTLRTTTTVAQSSTAASNGDNGVVHAARHRHGDDRRGGVQRRGGREVFQPRIVDEHHQLMKKHGNDIDNTEMESLNDAIERINWYSTVTSGTLDKISLMMKRASIEELNSISDRSMATLFSSFGEMNREMKRKDKRKLLKETTKKITEKGYSLGPITRTAIFTARTDMAQTVEELPSIVDELAAWEKDGVALTEDMIVQAARVYAIQGDRKGVIQLTNYARETFGRVEVRFVEWLSFSMVACGEGNGVAAIEKLARSAPESATRLWLSGALAAAYKADLSTVLECLSRVPHTAKIQLPMQNGPVVDILVHLLEREVEGAEQSLAAYLALSEDGAPCLYERHPGNPMLAFKARRAVMEGKLDVATRLYALVHPSHRNTSVEVELRRGLVEMGAQMEASVEEAIGCASRMHSFGILGEVNGFMLGAFKGVRLVEFVQQLRSTGQLTETMEKCRATRFALAGQLKNHPSSTPLSVGSTVAAILFSERATTDAERSDVDKFLFQAANEDPDVVVRIVEELKESAMPDAEFLAGRILSSVLARILIEKDVLESGRIEKILASPSIPLIHVNYLEGQLNRMVGTASEGKATEKAVQLAADILIAAFKTGGFKVYETAVLVRMFGNTLISDTKLEMLVNKLAQNPSVGIGMNEMQKAQHDLMKRGLKKRVELMGMLKRKSSTAARWMASSIEDLEMELDKLEKKEDMKDGLLIYIKTLLMEKVVFAPVPVSTDRMMSLLGRIIPGLNQKIKRAEGQTEEEYAQEIYRRKRLRDTTEKVYGKAMKQSVGEGDWTATQRLWRARGSIRSLPIAPSLALAYHELNGGSKELSAEIISTIRSTGLSVSVTDLYQLGDLLSDLSMNELGTVGEWLKKELRLEDDHVAKIKAAKVRRGIEDLINKGQLQEAFDVMKETSELAKNAVGHFDIMRAAIRYDNNAILQSTVHLVSTLHSKPTAILDLAYSFLLEKKGNYGETLLRSPSLKLSHAKIDFFINNAVEEQRIDVVHSLFSILVSCPVTDEKVSNTSLNNLANTTLRSYLRSENEEAAKGLVKEIEESTLVVEYNLQLLMDRVKRTARSSSV